MPQFMTVNHPVGKSLAHDHDFVWCARRGSVLSLSIFDMSKR